MKHENFTRRPLKSYDLPIYGDFHFNEKNPNYWKPETKKLLWSLVLSGLFPLSVLSCSDSWNDQPADGGMPAPLCFEESQIRLILLDKFTEAGLEIIEDFPFGVFIEIKEYCRDSA